MMSRQALAITILSVILVIAIVAYGFYEAKESVLLATTTSTYDSGLLTEILPDFEEKYDCDVKVTAVGTGQALTLGKNGDADVLLVHSPSREQEFVQDGYGLYREKVMYNQFVIVGPSTDPAGINGGDSAVLAFQMIFDSQSSFCSRGDDSGTHGKEKAIWESAGYEYGGISGQANSSWYLSLGQGMGDTLRTASETDAYAITDEGTFYSMENEVDLKILFGGDDILFNQYGVVPVNPEEHTNVNVEFGQAFAEWITSPDVQGMIDEYVKNGHKLFTANAE